MDCFEAMSLHFGCCHLVFLEPEVTIFGRKGGAEQMVSYQLMLAIAGLARFIGMLILANEKHNVY